MSWAQGCAGTTICGGKVFLPVCPLLAELRHFFTIITFAGTLSVSGFFVYTVSHFFYPREH